MSKQNQPTHDWRKLKWPFTVTFLYFSLLSLLTGTAEQSMEGFAMVFITIMIVDAVAYTGYLFFLSRTEENMEKLWFIFLLAYLLASSEQLGIVWRAMQHRAGVI